MRTPTWWQRFVTRAEALEVVVVTFGLTCSGKRVWVFRFGCTVARQSLGAHASRYVFQELGSPVICPADKYCSNQAYYLAPFAFF